MLGPVFWYGGKELLYWGLANPVAANSLGVGISEAAAGTSLAVGGGYQVFRNLAPADEIAPAIRFAAGKIQAASYSGRLNYVVSESGELVIGRTGHTSLSGGSGVIAAGEVKFVNGQVKTLNNASGHYRPSGESAKNAAESAFERAGFNARDKYEEIK